MIFRPTSERTDVWILGSLFLGNEIAAACASDETMTERFLTLRWPWIAALLYACEGVVSGTVFKRVAREKVSKQKLIVALAILHVIVAICDLGICKNVVQFSG